MTRPLRPLLVALALLASAAPAHAQSGAPDVSSPSAIVMEASTGDVVFERAPDERRAIASTTKLMTALVALEGAALDDTLTATPYAAGPLETVVGLRAGERMRVSDLIRALMLPSANDAAATIATGVSGSIPAFVREMNARAKALGLRNTSYANPVGLDDPDNRSTARDLVKLAAKLRENAFFRATVDEPRAVLKSGARRRAVVNRNTLVRTVPEVDGVKTGRTQQAGFVLVGSATRDGVTVLSAVLGAGSEAARDADSLALLRYGLSRFQRRTVLRRGQPLARADLKYRDERVRLAAGTTVRRVLRRGQRARVRVVDAPKELEGPLPKGAPVGSVEVRQRGRVVARAPLVTAAAVEEASLVERVGSLLSRPTSLFLIIVLGGCTVLLVLLRRRVMRRTGA
jgi:D-alanyl-D-alanine carboxypeptidase (penicillin-binding protein 5/6)